MQKITEYLLHVADYKNTVRTFIVIGIIAFFTLMVACIYLGSLDHTEALPKFMLIMLGMVIGAPVIIYLFYLRFIIQKTLVSVNSKGISTNTGINILIEDITHISKEPNRNGYNSLLVITLKNGKKYSFTPTNKFAGLPMREYNGFVKELLEYY